jgi:hypothetical protein
MMWNERSNEEIDRSGKNQQEERKPADLGGD